jgi:hypothetical protein
MTLAANPDPAPGAGVNAAVETKDLAGTYCPDMASTYLILEELTVATEGVARARESLLVFNDMPTAQMLLARADAALASAVGRGSGARVATLINALLAAKEEGNAETSLLWFRNIKLALSGLPVDAARDAAFTQIARAEAILQGQAEGDEVQTLLEARRLMECDALHIPMRESLTRLVRIHGEVGRGAKPSSDSFSVLIDHLNRAMSYALQRLIDLERR